ncbi:Eukaryotic translation initiation factor 5A [Rhynchospora pubera]|uniref:Eukaryotic translation initiation factor 5A n=2 Tax=Rhynchospora pubera TaxID=906938 RepID=A0AAV8HHC9_9POAL|nr:Eukaryotic translation initiation factor 5A [Rhynchospora pubera]
MNFYGWISEVWCAIISNPHSLSLKPPLSLSSHTRRLTLVSFSFRFKVTIPRHFFFLIRNSSIFALRFGIMSDEEHHFESKADAGASKTYPQQAGTIRKNGYIVIKGRPCKVVEVSTSKTGKHGHAKCHFVAIDIFNGKKLEDIVPSSHNCDVPHVNRTEFQLIDISEDGFVSLLTENGGTKDDLRLPTDDTLLTQIKDGFDAGKDLVVTVMSAMGEEQICALKDIGPK